MKFADIFKANNFIKEEEKREKSEFLDHKVLTHYGLQN